MSRPPVECFACGRHSSPPYRTRYRNNSLRAQGWRRRFHKADNYVEAMCPGCFAVWGWQPRIKSYTNRVNPLADTDPEPAPPRVYKCHAPRSCL